MLCVEPGAAGNRTLVDLERELPAINDGSYHTYASLAPDRLPADAGIQWNSRQRLSSVIIRCFNGRMARNPAAARTQDWGRLQYLSDGKWIDLAARRYGQEVSTVRYVFSTVSTDRIRFLFSEPPDPEARRFPDRLAICEFEAYDTIPFQAIESGGRLVKSVRKASYLASYNEAPAGDGSYEIAGKPVELRLIVEVQHPERSLRVIRRRLGDNPFSSAGAPVDIPVKARKIPGWGIVKGSAGPLPTSPVSSGEPIETVTLVPYGSAKLRIIAFPLLNE